MITDPKTTVKHGAGGDQASRRRGGAEAGIRLAGDFHVPALTRSYPAPPILALAIVGRLRT